MSATQPLDFILRVLHSCTSLINDCLDLLSVSSDLLSGSFRKKSTESTAINASLYIIIQIVKSDSAGSQDRHERDRSFEYRYHLRTVEVRDRECFDKCSAVLKAGNSLSYTCAARCIRNLITVANDCNFFAQVRSDDELCTSQDCMSCSLSIQNSTSTYYQFVTIFLTKCSNYLTCIRKGIANLQTVDSTVQASLSDLESSLYVFTRTIAIAPVSAILFVTSIFCIITAPPTFSLLFLL